MGRVIALHVMVRREGLGTFELGMSCQSMGWTDDDLLIYHMYKCITSMKHAHHTAPIIPQERKPL